MSKRIFDFGVAALGLLLLSSPLLLVALLINLDSPGPALFRQERIRKGFRLIRIYKFRTMVHDAPRRGGPIRLSGQAIEPKNLDAYAWINVSKRFDAVLREAAVSALRNQCQ